ncbi:MAG: substrate-binding domain-containing protein [Bacteroidetes bacterium]|nr:substrate-binding domain-containing protein [Bacteroidota bacterium]
MMNKILSLVLLFLLINCKKKEVKETPSYNKGEITIYTDDAYHSVVEALAGGYEISYPETKITVKTEKEDLAFLDLLNGKVKMIAMSRDLNDAEKKEYEKQIELKYQPAKFAADAVVFIVPKSSAIDRLSYDDIVKGLQSQDKPFVFDGANSSNINFVAQKIGIEQKNLNFSVVSGNKNLAEQLHKFPNKIGVIGLNTISRIYNKNTDSLSANIKILPIEYQGKLYFPDSNNLREMTYPFTRVIYFLANEGNFNLANGIIRYSCTQLGQMIVEKEGLQPYNLYKREVQMK